MKALILSLFIAISAYLPAQSATQAKNDGKQTEYVYICLGPKAYAYHSDYNCRGLQRCTHQIIRTTKDSAINYYNRSKPCSYCYR
jgi:hypothetical protein